MDPSMNSTDDISKKMESMSITTTQRVVRRNKRKPLRFCPYSSLTSDVTNDEKLREEAVQFGVKFSVLLTKAMSLYSDDIRSVLCFCFLIFKHSYDPTGNVFKSLVGVMEHSFAKYIKPKNGVYKDGAKMLYWEEINTFERYLDVGFRCLDLFVLSILGTRRFPNTNFYRHCLPLTTKKLESLLEYVNKANGFPREAIDSEILHFWKDLFETTNSRIRTSSQLRPELREDILDASGIVEEALETTIPQLWKSLSETAPKVKNQPRITSYPGLFRPLVDECKRYNVFVRELSSLSL